eukprot:jgi/Mesvir1/20309/Mv19903-RA.2
MSFAVYRSLHSPTGVSLCTAAYFTHPAAVGEGELDETGLVTSFIEGTNGDDFRSLLPNLIVIKETLLEIYTIGGLEQPAPTGTGPATADSDKRKLPDGDETQGSASRPKPRLELVERFSLHGVVQELAVIHGCWDSSSEEQRHRQCDALLLVFGDAELSVVEWDEANHNIRCSSLHSYEGPQHEALKDGRRSFAFGPRARSDPKGRCAGVLIYGTQLLLLPCKTAADELLSLAERPGAEQVVIECAPAVESSFITNMRDLGIWSVRDLSFLHGYNRDPVLMVLHETTPSWVGNKATKFACCVAALGVDLAGKRLYELWTYSGLPHNSTHLVAVPPPINGALVFGVNLISYYGQNGSRHLVLNKLGYAPEAANSADVSASQLEVEVDAAKTTWLLPNVALLSLKDGVLLLLSLTHDGREVRHMELTRVGSATLASGMCMLGEELLFIGSRLGESMLVRISRPGDGDEDALPASKRSRLGNGRPDGSGATPGLPTSHSSSSFLLGDSHEDELIFMMSSQPSRPANAAKESKSFSFSVVDKLAAFGPVIDACLGKAYEEEEGVGEEDASGTGDNVHPSRKFDLVLACGHGKTGGLAVIYQNVRPQVITEVPLPSCRMLWTVHQSPLILPGARGGGVAGASRADADGNPYHAYMILSLADQTLVLETGEELEELSQPSGHFTQGPTVAVGNMFGRARVAQVSKSDVRLLDGVACVQTLTLADLGPPGNTAARGAETITDSRNSGTSAAHSDSPAGGDHGSEPRGGSSDAAGRDGEGGGGAASAPTIHITAASVVDPFLLLHLSDFSIRLLYCTMNRGQTTLVPLDVSGVPSRLVERLSPDSSRRDSLQPPWQITACTLYVDHTCSAWLSRALNLDTSDVSSNEPVASVPTPTDARRKGSSRQAPSPAPLQGENALVDLRADNGGAAVGPVGFAVLCLRCGALGILALPSLDVVYVCAGLTDGRRLLDTGGSLSSAALALDDPGGPAAAVTGVAATMGTGSHKPAGQVAAPHRPGVPAAPLASSTTRPLGTVVEVCMVAFDIPSGDCGRPFLLARMADGSLLGYKGVTCTRTPADALLDAGARMNRGGAALHGAGCQLKFLRLTNVDSASLGLAEVEVSSDPMAIPGVIERRLIPFQSAVKPGGGGVPTCGVFVCGPVPLWLLATVNGLHCHPQMGYGPVTGFMAFHNVNCAEGYIMATLAGTLKICYLPSRFTYDGEMPIQKVPLRGTVHRVTYHAPTNAYFLITSQARPKSGIAHYEPSDPMASGEFTLPRNSAAQEQFFLVLLAAGTWRELWRMMLVDGENGLCINAGLAVKDIESGAIQSFVGMGSAVVQGEDMACRGRLMLLTVEAAPEAAAQDGAAGGNVPSKSGVKVAPFFSKDMKGAITAITSLDGYVLAAVGTKITMHALKGSELTATAFYDTPLMVTSMTTVRGMVWFVVQSIYNPADVIVTNMTTLRGAVF